MYLGQLKKHHRSIMMTGLLAGMIGLSACQQEPEPEGSLTDNINAEESVPMSADPADPNDTIVTVDDATVNEVQEDTVAEVNTGITQYTYLCSPELKVEATYKDESGQVVVMTDNNTLTLNKTNDATNPEVFEVSTSMDGGEGFTQWRVAHEARETGVMRTAGADSENVTTYECKKAD